MVSTRNHPGELPPPDLSPSKASPGPTPSPRRARKSATPARSGGRSASGAWAHVTSSAILVWLTVSLPLVAWDTGYVFLRPHSMPGGKYHWPLWALYAIYVDVDHVYGFEALAARDGFTGAQAWLNVAESAVYLAYLWVVIKHGRAAEAEGAPSVWRRSWWGRTYVVEGHCGAMAALAGYTGAVMTVSKTWLYFLNEACSGFKYIGHNDAMTLFKYYVLPNGPWLAMATYMAYLFAVELYQAIMMASGEQSEPRQRAIKDE